MIKARDTTVGYHCPNCGMSILNRINVFTMEGNLIKIKCVCAGSELIVQSLKENKFKLTVPCILCPNSHSFTLSSGAFFQKDLFSFSCKFTAINICYIGGSNKVFEAMKQNEEELMKTFAAYEDEYGDEYDDDDYDYGEGGYDGDDYEYDDDYSDIFDGLDGVDGLDIFNGLLKPEEKEPGGKEPEEKEPGFILHKSGAGGLDKTADKDAPPNKNKEDGIPVHLRSYQITGQILDSLSGLCERQKVFCKCGDFDGKIVLAGNAVHIECKNCGSYRDIKSTAAADADYLDGMKELYLDFDE